MSELEFTDVVNRRYGAWVQAFNKALDAEELDDDSVPLLVDTKEIPLTRNELWKLVKQSYVENIHAHSDKEIDIGWQHSWFKRFWGNLRAAVRSKQALLHKKQQEHIEFKLSN
jgi:hypothetical protein